MLKIIYQDEWCIAINKPHGLLVHRSPIAADASEFAVQLLRDQVGFPVFPVHRLDRKTSGVLLFATKGEFVSSFQDAMQDSFAQKRYLAFVRGYFPEELNLDYPLTREDGKIQEAQTVFKKCKHFEVPFAQAGFQTSRYSLIEAHPMTGRMHQIRKHLNHLRHPIIGDRPHGCNKQNKFFLEQWNMSTMLLHAFELKMRHPFLSIPLIIEAEKSEEFKRVLLIMHENEIGI
jgi:tRNA pseudouridine65 synthase